MINIHFTPGPTEVHSVAKEAIRDALHSDICSLSHRSAEYEEIQANTEAQLRKLLLIPEEHRIFFIASGTESWERIIQNGVERVSYHLVNGSFSKRFYETAQELGKKPIALEVPLGKGFEIKDLPDNLNAELLCVTHNETSSGVCLPDNFIETAYSKYPDSLIAVDAVSSSPYPQIDLSKVDYYFFSVQKFFSMPAGLGVLIVSPRAIEKAKDLKAKSALIGSHHSILSLNNFAAKHQTPSTPNVLGIYTLGIMAEHFNIQGIENLRQETLYKADSLYSLLDRMNNLKAFVSETNFRSKTVITVEAGEKTSSVIKFLAERGCVVGLGYGKLANSQFRIANFAAHTVEDFDTLLSHLKQVG